ncbi:MAG: MMPL family transporter [Bacteroidales bacterium]|nr:MMPL family transporter [Bacteroidales bacterium]
MKIKIENIARFIIRNRIYILILIFIITAVSLTQLKKLRVFNDLTIWIDRSSDEYSKYREFIRDFGNDESIILLYHSDSLSTNSHLKLNYQITDSLKAIKGVKNVISLSTIKIPSSSVAGPAMVPLLPKATSHPERLKNRLLSYRTYADFVISGDFKTTSFTIIPDSSSVKSDVLARVKGVAGNISGSNGEFVIYGIVPLKEELFKLSGKESKTFLLITIIILLLFNYLLFRRLRESILPLFIALLSICWTLGLMSALGISLNIVISVLPLILLVISIANTIHFISGQIVANEKLNNKNKAVIHNFCNIFVKCFYSSFTTAIALFAFTITSIIPLKHFGLFASIGVMLSFILTFVLLPVIYSYSEIKPGKSVFNSIPALRNHNYAEIISSNRKSIYLFSLVIFTLSVIGITKLRVNTDQVTYFKKDHPVRVASGKAEKWFSGVIPFELVFNLDTSILKYPETYFQQLYRFEDKLAELPEIKSWQSVITILDDYGMIKNKSLSLPGGIRQVSDKSASLLSRFVSEDGKSLRTTIKTSWINDKEELELMRKIETVMEEVFRGSGVKCHFTGSVPVFAHLSNRLVNSQVRSFIFTFIIIFCVFLILYKKIRIALLCLIPNILPVACTIGIMGFLKIPLDVATVLIASVSFGMAVDDTIHFVSTYKENLQVNNNITAINNTFSAIGKPIIATSLLLIGGFIVMIFSSYRPIAFMGVFISVNVLLALLYDIILLPSLLLYRSHKTD